ncbi:MAG: hypothetical protein AB7Q01_16430 [Gammaproteobacteria bacterium]
MNLDADLLRDLLREELDARARVDAVTHARDHEFVALLIERRRIRAERWEKVKTHVLGWGAVAAVGWLASQVAQSLQRLFNGSNQ